MTEEPLHNPYFGWVLLLLESFDLFTLDLNETTEFGRMDESINRWANLKQQETGSWGQVIFNESESKGVLIDGSTRSASVRKWSAFIYAYKFTYFLSNLTFIAQFEKRISIDILTITLSEHSFFVLYICFWLLLTYFWHLNQQASSVFDLETSALGNPHPCWFF